jgi:hypothetical protein
MIGGNDLGTPQQSYLYCAAYGNGNFIVRGFGPSDDAARPLRQLGVEREKVRFARKRLEVHERRAGSLGLSGRHERVVREDAQPEPACLDGRQAQVD